MKELLAKLNLRRLPKDPIGFVPIIARGVTIEQNLGPMPFRIMIRDDPQSQPETWERVIEVMATPEDAQILLEAYLSHFSFPRYTKAVGMIRPFRLHEFFEAILKYRVAVPMHLGPAIKKILLHVHIVPRIYYDRLDHWQLPKLRNKEWQQFGLLPMQVKAVSELAAYLRRHSQREIRSPRR